MAMAYSNENQYTYDFKLVIVGDSQVGKNTLVKHISARNLDWVTSIGGTLPRDPKKIKIPIVKHCEFEKKWIELKIWLPSNSADPHELYEDADGIIVMYDVTNQESFENVEHKWMKEIHSNFSPNDHDVAVIIMGNKMDSSSERMISTESGRSYATKQEYQFMETSVKNNENVEESIKELLIVMISCRELKKELKGKSL